MGVASALQSAHKTYKDVRSLFETSKTAGALARAYVDSNRQQQNVVLSQQEAWNVLHIFFGTRMNSVKPGTLQPQHCKLAERTLIEAWKAYEEMNIVEALFKKTASPAAKLSPLGVANILMKIATVYLTPEKMPTQTEIDDFNRNGGLIRQQIEFSWQLYLADLIADSG